MLKVVVFDGGCGGEAVADYLASELDVVEIIRVIDFVHKDYETKSQAELNILVEKNLKSHIGKVDLIVLGGYTVSLALDYLRSKYQHQKFVGVGVNYYRILHASIYPMRVTAIMNETLLKSPFRDELKENLPYSTITVPDCSGWGDLASEGKLSMDIMQVDLGSYFDIHPVHRIVPPGRPEHKSILETVMFEKQHRKSTSNTPRARRPTTVSSPDRKLVVSDVVLILNTCLWNLKRDIEDVFGYRVKVMDFRQKLLHDVCLSLNLLGVDGERSK